MTALAERTSTEPVALIGRTCLITATGELATVEAVAGDSVCVTTNASGTVTLEAPSEAVVLPVAGEAVALTDLDGDTVRGRWLGVCLSEPHRDELAVRVLTVAGVRKHYVRTAGAHVGTALAERGDDAPSSPSVDVLAEAWAEVDRQITAARRTVSEHEEWKERLGAAAIDSAQAQSLCGMFDDFMEEWGLPSRRREFTVTVRVEGSVNVSVTAQSASAARDSIDSYDVRNAVDVSALDWTITDVEQE